MRSTLIERTGLDAQVPDWLFINEAATYSGMSLRTIRRWISTGQLKGYRRGPVRVVVKRADLDAMDSVIPTVSAGV